MTDEELRAIARIHASSMGIENRDGVSELADKFCLRFRHSEAELLADLYLEISRIQ